MTEENSKTNGDEGLIFGQPQTQLFGRGSRKHWHDDEISRMLDAIEKILPRRNRDWKNVVAAYNNDEKAKNLAYRDEVAIKNKFQVLKYVKKQPSDPNCPPLVARAKNLHKSIERNKILDNEIDAGSVSEAIAAKPLNAVNELASDAACLESRTVQTEDCTVNISSTLHSQQTEIRLPTLSGKKSTSLEQIPQTLSAKIYDDNQEFSKDNSSSDLTSAKKRQKLESLDQLDHNPDFFQLFLIESSKREERREEREARREEERRNEVKEQRDREERRAEKELEREERREERQRHHELLIASLLVKALGSRMDL